MENSGELVMGVNNIQWTETKAIRQTEAETKDIKERK